MTICPCCGSKSNLEWSDGCACGARSVGEPLPRPDFELPSFARSLVLAVSGSFLVLLLLATTVATLIGRSLSPLSFWSGWMPAAETAAWQLKFVMIPITIGVLWGSRKLYNSLLVSPERFCGLRYARRGYFASLSVPVLVVLLIGITVPTRLTRHQWSLEAADNAQALRIDRALDEYRAKYGTLPGELKELKEGLRRLPDADGSIATALENLDTSGYKPGAEVAVAPKSKQSLRGAVILKASSSVVDDSPTERLSFTNYELRLPGPDKVLNNDDDLFVRDGLVNRVSEIPERVRNASVTTRASKP